MTYKRLRFVLSQDIQAGVGGRTRGSFFMEEASVAEECEGGVPSSVDWWSPCDPVAKALQALAGMSAAQDRTDTQAVIVVLEEKRTEVRTKDQAGYLIRVWRELRNQVRKMMGQDSRYPAIKAKRAKP
jgi:uncharacterized protein YheU (UPF0270 family)